MQRPAPCSALLLGFELSRGSESFFTGYRDERMVRRVIFLDSVQARACQFDRRGISAADKVHDPLHAQPEQILRLSENRLQCQRCCGPEPGSQERSTGDIVCLHMIKVLLESVQNPAVEFGVWSRLHRLRQSGKVLLHRKDAQESRCRQEVSQKFAQDGWSHRLALDPTLGL